MERLTKAAIILGMIIGTTLFAMLLFSVLPNILEHTLRNWERLQEDKMTRANVISMIEQHPAYIAMYERYPDARQESDVGHNGIGSMTVGAINLENNNQLILILRHHGNDEYVGAYLECLTESDDNKYDVAEMFVVDMIRENDCLETGR